MEERLDLIRLQPEAWAHWDAVRGGLQAQALLSKRYPEALCYVVEPSEARRLMAEQLLAKPWWHPVRWTSRPLRFETPPPAAVQMLWANMGLHMAADPQQLIQNWHQALAVDGFLMFSCLGPDTLRELRGLYQAMDWPAPGHAFTDMHDWGDMLVHAGFAEPVMDMERITLTFDNAPRCLQELRQLGRNLHIDRDATVHGRAWHRSLLQVLDTLAVASPQHHALTFEVIYGHAIKAARRLPVGPQTSVPLSEMRNRLRGRRPATDGLQ